VAYAQARSTWPGFAKPRPCLGTHRGPGSHSILPALRECGHSATLASYATAALIPAGRLFAERGYEGTTLCDRDEAASKAKATLFHYFSTKEKILFEQYEAGFITGIDILAGKAVHPRIWYQESR